MTPTLYLRFSVEFLRKRGIDWNARGMWVANRVDTIAWLEKLLEDLKQSRGAVDGSAGS